MNVPLGEKIPINRMRFGKRSIHVCGKLYANTAQLPCQVGLVVSVSASHRVGRGFTSRPGHTKDHHKMGTNCLHALHACVRVGV